MAALKKKETYYIYVKLYNCNDLKVNIILTPANFRCEPICDTLTSSVRFSQSCCNCNLADWNGREWTSSSYGWP